MCPGGFLEVGDESFFKTKIQLNPQQERICFNVRKSLAKRKAVYLNKLPADYGISTFGNFGE